MNTKQKWLSAVLYITVFVTTPGNASASDAMGSIPQEITTLMKNGGAALQKSGRTLYSHNPENQYIPASIIKIATAILALDILGKDFQFTTNFFITPERDLYLQGNGDPFLVSEEMAMIVSHLRHTGVVAIRDIILDDTAFQLKVQAAGAGRSDNPYDAENSALSVNFNTVYFTKETSGAVHSAEPQTPTIPLMVELAQKLEPGTYRQNITGGDLKGQVASRHVGEVFQGIFQKNGGVVIGEIRSGTIPEGLTPLYSHQSSTTLYEGLRQLMKYSNNFIANQLFLTCGMKRFGLPATWEKGRQTLQEFMADRAGLGVSQIHLVEGSGLSRENRITPAAMVRILDLFKPHGHLLPEKMVRQRLIFLKSGTLTGVSTYAGYYVDNHQLDSFVLIINQRENIRDRLLGLLTRLYDATPVAPDNL